MTSNEVQEYLNSKGYKLTLNEYHDVIDSLDKLSGIQYLGDRCFFFKVSVTTSDGYQWGIYILNYGVDDSMVSKIVYD